MNPRTIVAIAVSSFAAASLAEATTITVPQGSGVFPTIGQINCLEEAGGTYCAATYECAGGEESGELWGDMANHNGRRPLSVESPVARARECVIFVDGAAEATWFTAHTPAGRDGLVVGLSPTPNFKPPVVERVIDPVASEGSLLAWLISERGLDIEAMRNDACSHLRDDASPEHRERCEGHITTRVSAWIPMAATPYARCVVDFMLEIAPDVLGTTSDIPRQPDGRFGVDAIFRSGLSPVSPGMLGGHSKGAFGKCDNDLGGAWRSFNERYPSHRAKQEECCALYREEANRIGLVLDDEPQ